MEEDFPVEGVKSNPFATSKYIANVQILLLKDG